MATVLVTGGTGRLGPALGERLRSNGHRVRVVSRRATGPDAHAVDLRTGHGLGAALDGVDTVIHAATVNGAGDRRLAGQVIDSAYRAGVRHLIYPSIVGCDRIPLGYYQTKSWVEHMVAASGLGWTVVRATQFHSLIAQILAGAAKAPIMLLPKGFRFQPVAPCDLADRLAGLVATGPAGRADDFGGPRVEPLADLARQYLAATGRRRRLAAVPLPGRIAAGYRGGNHLVPEHADGTITFAAYLAGRA